MNNKLIIFTRYPEAGKTKTRLIPLLGEEKAAHLQELLTRHAVETSYQAASKNNLNTEIHFTGPSSELMREKFGSHHEIISQEGSDLGERMALAFQKSYEEGYRKTVIIGSDIPSLTPELIIDAFNNLDSKDIVLGPAKDGGYYLIGLKKPVPEIFKNISWGTSTVFSKTKFKAFELGMNCHFLNTLSDIDRPEDIESWDMENIFGRFGEKAISVIIPTFNEEKYIEKCLERISEGLAVEIIISDGGSTDSTLGIAQNFNTKILVTEKGKAAQMNVGASRAKGEILLFLHADTLLPNNYDDLIRLSLQNPQISAGAFSFATDHSQWKMKVIETTANWRSRNLQLPYGDQGIFLNRELFFEIGGFLDIPIMEDFEFISRLKNRGKIVTLNAAALTSPRRFAGKGVFKTSLINQAIILGYILGISPKTLSKWYRS